MFELDELSEVFDAWRNRGILTSDNRTRLKAFYFHLEGIEPQGCTTCDYFWLQVKTKIYQYLKANGIIIMATNRKYQFRNSGKSYTPFASPTTYIIEGEPSKGVKVLTDSDIDGLIEQNPSLLATTFQLNPKYVAPKEGDATAKVAATSAPKEDAKRTAPAVANPNLTDEEREAIKAEQDAAKADKAGKAKSEKPAVSAPRTRRSSAEVAAEKSAKAAAKKETATPAETAAATTPSEPVVSESNNSDNTTAV